MLAMLGWFGAMMAGVAADAVMRNPEMSNDDNQTDDAPMEADEGDGPPPDLLWTGTDADEIAADGEGPGPLADGKGIDQPDGRGGGDVPSDNEGNDALLGGARDDLVMGEHGDDQLSGQTGNDQMDVGDGRSSSLGDGGDDSLLSDDDDWAARPYSDLLVDGTGQDVLDAGAGDDTLDGSTTSGAASTEFLDGGARDDALDRADGDADTAGADVFYLDNWVSDGSVETIADYSAAEDQIVVVYDANVHADPVVSLTAEDGSADVTILLNGVPLAVVQGGAGLMLDDIRLAAAA
jgi:Ca2+-binding RTX toxin-like protein